jgi:hypothetical protein
MMLDSSPICTFCSRPVTAEFAYRKLSAANAGLCTRKDCKKARKRAVKQAERGAGFAQKAEETSADSIRLQETGFGEGDATTDFDRGAPEKHHDVVVKSDLDDDSVPKLLKIRLVSGSNGAKDSFERAQRAAKLAAQQPAQSRREVFNSPVDHRSHRGRAKEGYELQLKVAEIERQIKGQPIRPPAPVPQENTPTSEKLTIDSIRNDWLREKVEGDNRVLLETIAPRIVDGVYSFRLSLGLTVQNLDAFIKDKKFIATSAISRRETTFYKDFAKGDELTVELMLKRHGVWEDGEIVELENRIIRHAVAVGLIVRPPHILPETEPAEDNKFEQTVIKTGGAEIGGGITVEKRNGKRRNGSSFNTRPPTTRVDPDKPGAPSIDAEWWDDYGEDSSS